MRAVDTNVLVRLITRDDARQAAAAGKFVEGGAWVSHLVLVETVWVLSSVYDREPAGIATAIGMLLDHQHLSIQDRTRSPRRATHYRKKPGTRFSDCLALETARKAGHLPLGTFDRTLAKIDGAARV